MKTTITLILLFAGLLCQAQTKVIAHKSHSGSTASFAKAYQKNLFDINRSNFGLSRTDNVLKLDTVIAVNRFTTIIKFWESKREYAKGINYKQLNKSDFIHRIDTVFNSRLLNKDNTIQFIKAAAPVLFGTPVDEVVFIGFKKQ